MAGLKFVTKDISGKEYEIEKVLSYQISMDWDAACHGVRLYFLMDEMLDELCTLRVYNNDKIVINGYVDTQRESSNENGVECFIYARSSACLLTDNEATPFTYNEPSALALCYANAVSLGFKINLPSIFSNQEYQVAKGTSCFGAINDFVEGVTGSRIMVTSDDCISLLQEGKRTTIDASSIISEKRVINRGDVITRLDYKSRNDKGFDHHLKSRFFEQRGIATSKKANLSALPSWQRDFSMLGMLKSSAQTYYQHEIVIDGAGDYELGDVVSFDGGCFGSVDDMVVRSVNLIMDKNGERTVLTLVKNIDLEEICYVD